MSYTLDSIGNPTYRRVIDSRTSYSRTSASPSPGFRSRAMPSPVSMSYKKASNVPVVRAFGSAVLSSSESLDLSQSSLLNGDFKRSNEKEQLQGLNDRFAGYIDKVHFLEQQNKAIEAEIQALRQKQVSQSQLGDVYDQELRELRAMLEEIHRERAQIQLDADHMEEDIQRLTERYQDEVRVREDTEAAIRAMKSDGDDSALIKSELQKKVQSLQDEAEFLRRNHEEEVTDLLAQLQASQITVDRKDYQKTDITEALREIRSQLDGHSSKNLQQAEDWFISRYSKLTEAAEQNKDAIKNARDEISEFRRQLQTKNIELESVRSTKESLERQLTDIEQRHNGDLASLQETIHQLDNELKGTKWEMARHLREYQDLLNVKMALDIEIAAYRKLLEGEETRFSSFSGGITSPSFLYRQPVTPSKVPKAKAEAPKMKVQHKFVEEIIEETRVEDEKDMDEVLAQAAEELSAEQEKEAGEDKEEEEQEKEEEQVAVEEEEEAAEEEEVVATTQAAVSSSPPEEEQEEEGEEDKKGEGETGDEAEKEGEDGDSKEREEEAEEDQEETEGGEEEEEKEGDDEESVVEETVLSTKATKAEATPEKTEEEKEESTVEEKEKGGEKEQKVEEDGGDQKSDAKEDADTENGKEATSEEEKEEQQDKVDEDIKEKDETDKKAKEEKTEEPVAKSEAPKVEAKEDKTSELEGKEDKKSISEVKEDKKSESEVKQDKKSESEVKEDKKSESEVKEDKKSESEDKKGDSAGKEDKKSESEVKEDKKSDSAGEEDKKSDSEDKKSDSEVKEDKKSGSDVKEDKKSDSEVKEEKAGKAVEKEDIAVNGTVEKDEKKAGTEKQEVVTNGTDKSPTSDGSNQKVVITERVETITNGEGGAKHVTTSVTVTETTKKAEETLQQEVVSTKKVEKITSKEVKQVTGTQ